MNVVANVVIVVEAEAEDNRIIGTLTSPAIAVNNWVTLWLTVRTRITKLRIHFQDQDNFVQIEVEDRIVVEHVVIVILVETTIIKFVAITVMD